MKETVDGVTLKAFDTVSCDTDRDRRNLAAQLRRRGFRVRTVKVKPDGPYYVTAFTEDQDGIQG